MNIIFFGASVTQQNGNSGYVPMFKKILENNKLNYDIIQKGFGSMHLGDAGICKIYEIIEQNPKVCFLDWFSTGVIISDKSKLFMYLDVIVRKLMLVNSQICFLLLERLDMCNDRLIMYNNVIEYCKLYNLHFIEIYNKSNKKELLRDTVHTTELGANLYASKIYEYFVNHMINNNIIYTNMPEENEYSNIQILQVNKEIHDEITMNGKFKILGIHQKIGNFTGVIEITRNNEASYKCTIWDQWCHFTRDTIKLSFPSSKRVHIRITQDTFNTNACKGDINFNEFKKYMHIYEIYYIGELCIE